MREISTIMRDEGLFDVVLGLIESSNYKLNCWIKFEGEKTLLLLGSQQSNLNSK